MGVFVHVGGLAADRTLACVLDWELVVLALDGPIAVLVKSIAQREAGARLELAALNT